MNRRNLINLINVASPIRRLGFFAALLIASTAASVAEDFGDISVSAQPMFSGSTSHGYYETRVMVVNHSPARTHRVTLTAPKNSWGYGNHIEKLTRSVNVPAGSRLIVSLLQPPLPMNGDGNIEVEVDGGHEGEIRAPNANNHASASYGSSTTPATVFISRSLDAEAVRQMLNADRAGFMASAATGAPDSSGSGMLPTAWMPDTRRYGVTNWIELDYASPEIAQKIRVYETRSYPSSGDLTFIGTNGDVLATLPLSSGTMLGGNIREYSLPALPAPVKSVRLNFRKSPPSSIGIDAVELVAATGSQWASGARASSDNSAAGSGYVKPGSSAETVTSLRAESSLAEWSDNWLAYTPFDAVALSADDFNSMPAPVAGALWAYLQAGGNVFIFGGDGAPEIWRSGSRLSLADGTEYLAGFGRCLIFPRNAPSSLDPKTVEHLRDLLKESARYWDSLPHDSGAANNVLHVVENLKVPVRGIVIIMLAFVILIGPANLIVLTRKKRRTWMLWTIPAISLITTLLVFSYSLISEGVTPDVRIAGITHLDQKHHHAATVGAAGFYCPLTPSGGLRFDYDTELAPLVNSTYDNSGSKREVDWTQAQQLRNGWIASRVPVFFHLRKSESRRERLEVEPSGGAISVVNGLGAPIKTLWLADARGKIFQATGIAAGQKIQLIPANRGVISPGQELRGLLRDQSFTAQHLDDLNASAPQYLSPGSYLAVLDGNPFIENGLGEGRGRVKNIALVRGILDSPETP